MNQFSADDERAGHAQMLARIRREQVMDQPEPDHLIRWTDVYPYESGEPVARYYCCDWHRFHVDDQEPA